MGNFDTKIQELVSHAYAHAPAIRHIMDAAGVQPDDIQTADDLEKLPVTSKDELVRLHQENPPFGGFLTIDPDSLPRIYISPGPIYDPQPPPDDLEPSLAPFKYVGFGKGDRVLNTFMYHLTPAGILIDDALRACGATVLPTGPGNTELQLMMMQSLQATGFVGQPSYLMTLLDKAEEMGITADTIPIKKALFSAEPYLPAQQERFEQEYGMRTTSAYGTADLGFIGYTVRDARGFVVLGNMYVEITDPDTGKRLPDGEIGELVVTTFNKAYPLIRFGTGDLSALAIESNAAINSAQHITGLFGRSGDAVKVRGMFLHPNQLNAAKSFIPQIKHIQAIVTRPENSDVVTLRVQLHEGTPEDDIEERLKDLAQKAVRLRIDSVVFTEIDATEKTIVDARDWN